ncbi:hypothetical protein QQX98_001450 [Neonectria punicea]|uniref:Uncharacterized protein n=1 Tax=Neonectria punicea TaxID=979145 RepID=A0ABR1HNT7_9HYPO
MASLTSKLIQIRSQGIPIEDREVRMLVEQKGGELLPAPLIFPPMYMIKGTEELASELRVKFSERGAIVNVLQDIE